MVEQAVVVIAATNETLQGQVESGAWRASEAAEALACMVGVTMAFAIDRLQLDPTRLAPGDAGDAVYDGILRLNQAAQRVLSENASEIRDSAMLSELIANDMMQVSLLERRATDAPERQGLSLQLRVWRDISDYLFGPEGEQPDEHSDKRRALATLVLRAHDAIASVQ